MKEFDNTFLQSVLDALQDGVYITNGEGLTLTVNTAYERITGIPRDEIIGRHVSELVTKGYISKSVSLAVIRDRQPVTLVQKIKNNRQILVSGNPMFDAAGQLIYVVSNIRDVTELLKAKYAEEQLGQWINIQQRYAADTSAYEQSPGIIASTATQACYDMAKRVADKPVKILILGETGTGKTQLAKYIHQHSERAEKPFMEINCAAMPEGLLESELFGYAQGAFSGASAKGKQGLLDVASGGTLFLDEIGDMSLSLQAKLLKVVEENKFLPIGSTVFKQSNIRLITATHRDLMSEVTQGTFRRDLYYRICVIAIELPPLRQRRSEIVPLLQHYMQYFSKKYHAPKTLNPDALEILMNQDWLGNIRELINLTEQLVLTSEKEEIGISDLPKNSMTELCATPITVTGTLKEQVISLEKRVIEKALAQCGTTRAAATRLGIDQSTLVKKVQRWKQSQE